MNGTEPMKRQTAQSHTRGFTLIEIIAATAISAILVLSINTVLYNSFHLRDRAYESLERLSDRQYALNVMKDDLRNLAAPTDGLSKEIISETQAGMNQQGNRLILYSTTGKMNDTLPWPEVQRIEYSLQNLYQNASSKGPTLTRTVSRNVLSEFDTGVERIPLLQNVKSLRFLLYDGSAWTQAWDSNTQDPPIPEAISVQIEVWNEEAKNAPQRSNTNVDPFAVLELVVPIRIDTFALEESAEEDSDETESEQESAPEDQNDQSSQGGQSGQDDRSNQQGRQPGSEGRNVRPGGRP